MFDVRAAKDESWESQKYWPRLHFYEIAYPFFESGKCFVCGMSKAKVKVCLAFCSRETLEMS